MASLPSTTVTSQDDADTISLRLPHDFIGLMTKSDHFPREGDTSLHGTHFQDKKATPIYPENGSQGE